MIAPVLVELCGAGGGGGAVAMAASASHALVFRTQLPIRILHSACWFLQEMDLPVAFAKSEIYLLSISALFSHIGRHLCRRNMQDAQRGGLSLVGLSYQACIAVPNAI